MYCIKILELENMHIAFTYMHLMKEFFYPKKKKIILDCSKTTQPIFLKH